MWPSIDWATLDLALVSGLGSGVVVAVITHLLSERTLRRSFRRQRLFDLKLEAYIEFLSALDTMISCFEATLRPGPADVQRDLAEALVKQGVPSGAAKQFSDRVGATLHQSFVQMSWSVLGYDGPIAGPAKPEAPATPGGLVDPLAGLEDAVRSGLRPALTVMTECEKRIDRCYVRLNLLGVSEGVDSAASKLRRRIGKFGLEGGIALASGSQADKEKVARAWRKDWNALASECGEDLADAMS